jgi:hypothetical protein
MARLNALNVNMESIVLGKSHFQDVASNADMMKVRQQALCLTSASFPYCLPFILLLKSVQRRKGCHHWN